MKKLVYYLDDEQDNLDELADEVLDLKPDWALETFHDPLHLIERVVTTPPDLFVTDLNMPMMNGEDVAKIIAKINPLVKIAYLTSASESDKSDRHILGFYEVRKPVDYQAFKRIDQILFDFDIRLHSVVKSAIDHGFVSNEISDVEQWVKTHPLYKELDEKEKKELIKDALDFDLVQVLSGNPMLIFYQHPEYHDKIKHQISETKAPVFVLDEIQAEFVPSEDIKNFEWLTKNVGKFVNHSGTWHGAKLLYSQKSKMFFIQEQFSENGQEEKLDDFMVKFVPHKNYLQIEHNFAIKKAWLSMVTSL